MIKLPNLFVTLKNNRFWLAICCFSFALFIIFSYLAYRAAWPYFFAAPGSQNQASDICTYPETCSEDSEPKDKDLVRRLIDGVYVKPGEENAFLLAVMIDNQAQARPQPGLTEANLVFEAEVEGNITRFLAVYTAKSAVGKIGPVRSARPYFIDWARELSALYVHSGGSPEALVKVSKDNIRDFNEFYYGNYFWRDASAVKPHNIFTSSDLLGKYLVGEKLEVADFFSWQFKGDLPLAARPDEAEIKIVFNSPDYAVLWKYQKESNDYLRYQAGREHLDDQGRSIRAKNVVIEKVETEIIDDLLRLKMTNLGAGQAFVCRDGSCQESQWRKKNSASRSRFYNLDGHEFEFNAGPTWVEVVGSKTQVEL